MSTTAAAAAAGPVLPAPDLGTVDGDGVTTAGLVVALDAVYVELGANVRTCELELGLVVAVGAVTDAVSARMVTVAEPVAMVPLVALFRLTWKVSVGSAVVEAENFILKLCR